MANTPPDRKWPLTAQLIAVTAAIAVAGVATFFLTKRPPTRQEKSDLAIQDAKYDAMQDRARLVTDAAWNYAALATGGAKRNNLPVELKSDLDRITAEQQAVAKKLGPQAEYDGYKPLVHLSPGRWEKWLPLIDAGEKDLEAAAEKFRRECDVLEKRMEAGEITAAEYERLATEKLVPIWKAAMDRVEADAKVVQAVAP